MHAARPSVNAISRTLNKKIDMETTTTQSETSAGADKPSLNPDALNQLLGQMVNDLGASAKERSLYLATGLEFTRRLLILARRRHNNSPKRPISMSDSFANGLVPRLLLDTLAMMREATLFFSLPNRWQCSPIQIALPR